MGSNASLLDLIAHGGSLRANLDNENLQANTGNLQANAERQRADIPLLNQQTEQAKVDTAIKQQQWKDLQAEMDAWAKLSQPQQAQPQTAPQPQAPAGPQVAPTGAPGQAPSPVGPAPQPMLAQGLIHRDVNAPLPGQAPAQPTPQIATPAFNPNAPAANASMVNPISNPTAYAQFLQRAGVSGPYAMQRIKSLVDYQKDVATMDKDQLANETTKHSMIGAALSAWQQNPSEEGYQQLRDFAHSKEPEIAALLPKTAPPPDSPALAAVAGITGAHEKMLADAKTKQETATSAAAETASKATTRKTGIEADEAQFKFNLMRNAAAQGSAPQAITDSVKNMSVFAGHPQEMQDAIDAATLAYQGEAAHDPLNATNKALEAVKEIADRLRENSPGVAAGKANTAATVAAAESAARMPFEEKLAQTNAAFTNALQQGDKAAADYYESLSTAQKSLATANTIQRVIDLSKSGNAIAGQQLKAIVPEFTNAMQDIKRMAGAQGNEGMSNAYQKAIGHLKSLADGVPLDAETIRAIQPYVETVANGAMAQHNANVASLSKAYPQKSFKAEPMPNQSAVNPKTGHRIVSHDSGQTWQDAETGRPI